MIPIIFPFHCVSLCIFCFFVFFLPFWLIFIWHLSATSSPLFVSTNALLDSCHHQPCSTTVTAPQARLTCNAHYLCVIIKLFKWDSAASLNKVISAANGLFKHPDVTDTLYILYTVIGLSLNYILNLPCIPADILPFSLQTATLKNSYFHKSNIY